MQLFAVVSFHVSMLCLFSDLLKHHITPEPLCSLTAEGKTIRMSDTLGEMMVMSGIKVESDATAEPVSRRINYIFST